MIRTTRLPLDRTNTMEVVGVAAAFRITTTSSILRT